MLIRNARLWDGTGAGVRPGMTLHAPQERIAWIGPDARAPAPGPEETVVDAAGRWLLPGLIDLHVHLTFDPAEGDFRRYDIATPVPEQALLGAHHARLMLEAGFTAVRDVRGHRLGQRGPQARHRRRLGRRAPDADLRRRR